MQKNQSLFTVLKLSWLIGFYFLVLCCTFGAISKLLYPTSNELSIPISLQYIIGSMQLSCVILLLREPWRYKGLLLCTFLFSMFFLNGSIDRPFELLFSLIGFCICITLWSCRFDDTVPIKKNQKDDETSIAISLEGAVIIEENRETEEKKNLWMETANEKDIMSWLHESDEDSSESS